MATGRSETDVEIDKLLVRHKAKTDMVAILRREAEEIARKIRQLEARSQRGAP